MESAADVWKRILDVERNCEFETITAAELFESKFLSVIGKSTGDYDLTKTNQKCAKCKKIGHYVKCCRTNKKVNRIQEHETSSAEEDDWSPNTIHCVNQKIHSTRRMRKDGPDFFTLTALGYNRPIKFIIENGSPVTLIPKSQSNRITPLKPLETEYRDVNDNQIRFEGKTTARVEIDGKRSNLEILVTTKKTNPLLGLDWTKKWE